MNSTSQRLDPDFAETEGARRATGVSADGAGRITSVAPPLSSAVMRTLVGPN